MLRSLVLGRGCWDADGRCAGCCDGLVVLPVFCQPLHFWQNTGKCKIILLYG